MDQKKRINDAVEQLLRYGGGVADERLLDVLDLLTDINDDICHARHKDIITKTCEKAAETIRAIAAEYEA